MRHLLICGAAGFTNLGDDAILWGMLSGLRDSESGAASPPAQRRYAGRELCVVGGPELPALLSEADAVPIGYDDRDELARAIEDADLVILGGGGMLYDIGYAAGLARFVGDPPDRQWLYELARIAAAARVAGKPVMCYAVGVGPLLTEAARRTAAFIADQCAAVTVRDEHSREALRACGVPAPRIHVAADPAVLVSPGPPEGAERWLRESGVSDAPRPWVAMNIRPWYRFGREREDADAEAMQALIRNAAQMVRGIRDQLGGTAVLLPFQRMYDDDLEVADSVLAAAGECGALIAHPPAAPSDLSAALARFDLSVGMRMHFLLLSLAAGVPFVALTYSEKSAEVARMAGLADRAHPVDDLDPEAVLHSCEAVLSSRAQLVIHLAEVRAQLVEAAEIPAALVRELLESGAPQRRRTSPPPAPSRPPAGLRVLMQTRPDFREKPGGDVVQLEELLPHLREAGVEAELTGDPSPDLSQWDLVHTINLDRPEDPYRHCLNALAQGKPIAVSPVHNDMTEFLEWGDPDYWDLPDPEEGVPRPKRAPLPHPVERRRRALQHLQRQAILDWAAICLPNSQTDADYLTRTFSLDPDKCVVVHHGIHSLFFEASPDAFVEKYGLRDFVLCVARVEAKKNQLSLVAAMRGTGIPLVIVGRANPEEYRELCRRYADDNVLFLDPLPQDELVSAFAAAKVHALVSWIELPGLVSMEAAAAGCNVVSTDRGSPREYLGEHAWYCDPRDVDSIREAVLAAHAAPRSDALRERIRQNYTWERAAQRTREGYQAAMARWEQRDSDSRAAASLAAMQRHVDWLAREVADREYEVRETLRRLRQAEEHVAHLENWGRQWEEQSRALEAELKRWQEEMKRITNRRLFRWSEAVARAGWSILRKMRIKP